AERQSIACDVPAAGRAAAGIQLPVSVLPVEGVALSGAGRGDGTDSARGIMADLDAFEPRLSPPHHALRAGRRCAGAGAACRGDAPWSAGNSFSLLRRGNRDAERGNRSGASARSRGTRRLPHADAMVE